MAGRAWSIGDSQMANELHLPCSCFLFDFLKRKRVSLVVLDLFVHLPGIL